MLKFIVRISSPCHPFFGRVFWGFLGGQTGVLWGFLGVLQGYYSQALVHLAIIFKKIQKTKKNTKQRD